eukprot:gnl/MRDRNA2_/MRDRNA2_71313_c0_seq1.p1 gnl/MRDRNA2_/MRDRNA2_71313_c0~~gnl/MRDRNA2_/MRDRNA2_71313_c0_seq1.p1  ORF type:complete len:129 (-),score=38.30 gnl/MRDRNA2_/MRDRNA2_71313_c0_seq1:173-559(-)
MVDWNSGWEGSSEEQQMKDFGCIVADQIDFNMACREGWDDDVKDFLENKRKRIDIDLYDDYEMTPLLWAAVKKNHDIMKMLLEAGADYTKADCFGRNCEALCDYSEVPESKKVLLDWLKENPNAGGKK